MGKGKSKKKKKERITYIDDGRTIADMSGVSGPRLSRRESMPRSSARDRWRTYKEAVRMMFLPMLVTLAIICIAFGIMYLLL